MGEGEILRKIANREAVFQTRIIGAEASPSDDLPWTQTRLGRQTGG